MNPRTDGPSGCSGFRWGMVLVLLAAAACTPGGGPATPLDETIHARRRAAMVAQQLKAADIRDPKVLETLGRVPRHKFVPPELEPFAYEDRPLPIGLGQTISQPYIVALMTQLARPKPTDRALDVGTGSGYQAAILAELVRHVYSIEILCPLADAARRRLDALGYREKITVRCGDGWRGWPEHAPFDIILVAAAPAEVPPALLEQLAVGGRLILPVGAGDRQELIVITRQADGTLDRRTVLPVRFVPMTGEARK